MNKWQLLSTCLEGQKTNLKGHRGLCTNQTFFFLFCFVVFFVLGETAQNFFDRVKRTYFKHRLELKKVGKSGTSSSVADKARRELNAYSFLFWLDAYLKPRRTRCNIPDNISDVSTGSDDEESCDENIQKD